MVNISIKNLISKDLSLRDTAQAFFRDLQKQNDKNIMVDFTDVRSISRSFAHEYLLQKENSPKKIDEINMSEHIQRMFDIVKNADTKPRLVSYNSQSVMSLKTLQTN
jgi:hypothetical protein